MLGERERAAALARHYREVEHLKVAEIAERLDRRPATITAYLYDPDGSKARAVKARYRGVCTSCGEPTWGSGPGAHGVLCARCNGLASGKWSKPMIEEALRTWTAMFGEQASSADLSLAHAKRAAGRDGGVRLRRLQNGWTGGRWPAASVVQYHYGTVAAANQAALVNRDGRPDAPP
jgi:hypothetical protein